MRKELINDSAIYLDEMEDVIWNIDYVNHIFTDPPYLYNETYEFDKEFDEALLFENAWRILPDNGFIALFDRGTSSYRWNTLLAELEFVFKEEFVWNKMKASGIAKHILRDNSFFVIAFNLLTLVSLS